MKRIFLVIGFILYSVILCFSAPNNSISIPTSFSPQTTISSSETNANNNEVATKYNVHTHTDITSLGTITTGTWQGTTVAKGYGGTGNAYGLGLPSGAVFFMVSGTCPSGTTNVSSTYSNKFVRINATAGSTSGADTHTHTAGTFAGPSHTHGVPVGYSTENIYLANQTSGTFTAAWSTGAGGASSQGGVNKTLSDAGGTGTVTGTSASGDNVPAYVTMIACSVD
jgi:hypothetical protein